MKVFAVCFLLFVVFVSGVLVTGYGETSYIISEMEVPVKIGDIQIGTTNVVETIKTTNYVWWYFIDAGSDTESWFEFENSRIENEFPILRISGAQYSYDEESREVYTYLGSYSQPDNYEIVGDEIILSLYYDDLAIQFRLDRNLKLVEDQTPVIRYKYSGLVGQAGAREWVEFLCEKTCNVSEKEVSAYSENGAGGSSGSYVLGTGNSRGWVDWHGQEDLLVYGSVTTK